MKSGVRFLLASLMISLAPFGSAYAQNALVLRKLAEWNDASHAPSEQVIKVALQETAEKLYSQTAPCLGSGITISRVEPATADRYAFQGRISGTLKNAWFVTVQIPKCDTAPVRFMLLQQADNSLQSVRVNRGVSYAWESLLSDTFPLARLAADAALKQKGVNCGPEEKAVLGVTRILSEEPGLEPVQFGIRYKGSWNEVWPIELCNHTVEVVVQFTADGDGGAYNRTLGTQTRVLP